MPVPVRGPDSGQRFSAQPEEHLSRTGLYSRACHQACGPALQSCQRVVLTCRRFGRTPDRKVAFDPTHSRDLANFRQMQRRVV